MPPGRDIRRTLPTLLDDGSADADAILSNDTAITYGQLRQEVLQLAAGLRASGLAPGDRALVVLPNGPRFVVAMFAIWKCGAIAVPIDARTPKDRALAIAQDCSVTAMLVHGVVLSRFEARLGEVPSLRILVVDEPRPASYLHAAAVLDWDRCMTAGEQAPSPEPECDRRAPALLAYTSGSTGRPKGVMHSHEGLVSSLAFTCDHLELSASDRVLVAFPMYHLFALRVTLAHLWAGAIVIAERDLLSGLRRAEQTRPNVLALVPAACQLLVDRFASVLSRIAPDVRRVSIGSAAISPALLAALRTLLPNATMHVPYGMTEARIGFLDPNADSAHRRLLAHDPRLQLSVEDEHGAPVHGGIGELVLRGPALTLGYWHQREADNEQMHRQGLRTRDLMRVDDDGERYLVGRLDDVISVGGEKVFPLEVELALRGHATVCDARVVGVSDPSGVRGQVVHAEVVLADDQALDEAALRRHCREHLEPYKVPAVVRAVAQIPRNAMGKIVAIDRSRASS